MPVVRSSTRGSEGETEGEGVTGAPVSGTASAATRELNRVTGNLTLADHIGRFVAGEVARQFQNENLSELVKGKNMIMISGSWG